MNRSPHFHPSARATPEITSNTSKGLGRRWTMGVLPYVAVHRPAGANGTAAMNRLQCVRSRLLLREFV